MPENLASVQPSPVAVRQGGGDRRVLPDRRQAPRATQERRVSQRRRSARIARAGLLVLLALALPKKEGSAPSPGLVEVLKTEFRLADGRENLDEIITAAASRYGVRPDLVRAIIQVESGFNPVAVSRVGARGLMQLMPRTAAHLGASDLFDPEQNIYAGVKYLSILLDRFDGNVALAVAGYNAGPNAVGRYRGRIPPYRETRGYVKRVQAAQAGWIRENGETNLEPFEIRPALLEMPRVARHPRGRAALRAGSRGHRSARHSISASRTGAHVAARKTAKSRRGSRGRRGGLRA
ncbi:MAG TPA: lytic transglycosylase domain-containing protein [Vicinamibacteria bacterium]|nr:lytic transglycosylase domain-containing protein [Vicinamibacteria bacterium]